MRQKTQVVHSYHQQSYALTGRVVNLSSIITRQRTIEQGVELDPLGISSEKLAKDKDTYINKIF